MVAKVTSVPLKFYYEHYDEKFKFAQNSYHNKNNSKVPHLKMKKKN